MDSTIEPVTGKITDLANGFVAILPKLGIAAVVFLLFVLAAWAARLTVENILNRRERNDLGALLGGFVKWALLLFGVLVVATIIFPSIKPADLLASLGVGSVAIGFAFKDILQNWVSGLLILYRQPFQQGDQIVSGSYEGTVKSIKARATQLRTYDGQRIVIPNSDIYSGVVTVRTAFEQRRSEYDIGIGYGDDIEQACDLIVEAMKEIDGISHDPAPGAIPWELAGFSVNIRARWWTKSRRKDVVHIRGKVIVAVKNKLIAAGIDLPLPTTQVLFHDQTEVTDGNRAAQREGWPAGKTPPLSRFQAQQTPDALAGRSSRRDV